MRLLDAHTFPPLLPQDEFTNRPYAILSHVWEENELTLSDLHNPDHAITTESAAKIHGAQRQAVKDGLDNVWIDTLCIDKSSSAELGEAINSMYRWYQDAEVCYVYLADLDGCPPLRDEDLRHPGETASKRYWGALFKESMWFKRGWTLQELIAPERLRFYDQGWSLIGDLTDLACTVAEITGIHFSMLQHTRSPKDFSIAQRMCWAAGRRTTRPEDTAYSLLGILDMSIDIRYGEGVKAFIRLQEAIIERNADQSIFAWEKTLTREEDVHLKERRNSYLWCDDEWTQLLAPSPDAFANAHDIVPCYQASLPYRMTNMGLNITTPTIRGKDSSDKSAQIILNCYNKKDATKAILLNLRLDQTYARQQEQVTFGHVWLRERSGGQGMTPFSRLSYMDVDQALEKEERQELYIARSKSLNEDDDLNQKYHDVWLQIKGYVGVGNLDFESSNPIPSSQTNNLT